MKTIEKQLSPIGFTGFPIKKKTIVAGHIMSYPHIPRWSRLQNHILFLPELKSEGKTYRAPSDFMLEVIFPVTLGFPVDFPQTPLILPIYQRLPHKWTICRMVFEVYSPAPDFVSGVALYLGSQRAELSWGVTVREEKEPPCLKIKHKLMSCRFLPYQ